MSFADLVINKINGDFYIIFYIVLRITINEVENKMKLTIKKHLEMNVLYHYLFQKSSVNLMWSDCLALNFISHHLGLSMA
jgi:hypothetical protein